MIDLHTHSTFSDGMCTPAQLAEGAAAHGLNALAITDHDTVAGWVELKQAAKRHGIEAIPGVELASDYRPADLHILGYFFDPASGILRQHLDWLYEGRRSRHDETVAKLHQMGLPLGVNEVETFSKGKTWGRQAIAKAMVRRGYVKSVREAFSSYLGKSRPAYVPRHSLSPDACIQLIHEARGIAILAHPITLTSQLTPGLMSDLLDYLVEAGLDGIEVYCPAHSDRDIRTFIRMAHSRNLLMTGGSDFHSDASELKFLGRVRNHSIPDSLLSSLQRYTGSGRTVDHGAQ